MVFSVLGGDFVSHPACVHWCIDDAHEAQWADGCKVKIDYEHTLQCQKSFFYVLDLNGLSNTSGYVYQYMLKCDKYDTSLVCHNE